MLSARAGRSALRSLAPAPAIQAHLMPAWQRVRYSSYQKLQGSPGGRILKLLGVFGLSGVAVSAYFLVAKGDEPQQVPAKVPQAELVFERARKQATSHEESKVLISSQHLQVKKSWQNPGVYSWGWNMGQVAAPDSKERYIKTPRRISYFDGKLLRDLKLDKNVGVAVMENGDLVQWGTAVSNANPAPIVTLKGKDLVKVALSQDRIIALSTNGAVLSLPVSTSDDPATDGVQRSATSWIPFWSNTPAPTSQSVLALKPDNLGWGEKIIDVSGGREHCLMLTSKGRVFSAATSTEGFPSRGQLGVPGLTWDTRPPGPYYRPHEVVIPSQSKATSVSTGDFHSLILDAEGNVYAFGSNAAGQLGIPMTTDSVSLDKPLPLPIKDLYGGTGLIPRVTSIAAGGLNSFFTVEATSVKGQGASSDLVASGEEGKIIADTWACGEGIYGNLGTGRWTHGQPSTAPTKVKALSNLIEFDDAVNRAVPIRLSHISVGNTHASAVMKNITNVSASETSGNDTNWGADVLFWGRNESYQLGTGKRSNENMPVHIGALDSGKNDTAKGKNGEMQRLQITPRKTVRLGEEGKGRKVSVEQRVECGRDISAVYSAV